MKNISLILLFCIVQYSLTSTDVITMDVVDGIDRQSINCDTNYFYSFNIPVTNVYIPFEIDDVSFSIPLVYPADTTVKCTLMSKPSENLKSSDEQYLHCQYYGGQLQYSKIQFYSTYDWQTVVIDNWNSTIGKDPIVEEYAKCSIYESDYDFAFFSSINDKCDSDNPGYQRLDVRGGIIVNGEEGSLTSSDITEEFVLTINADQEYSLISCILFNIDSNSDDERKGSMQCLLNATTISWEGQSVTSENKKTIYIAGNEGYDLKSKCSSSSSSWLSLSLLLFFVLILI